MDLARGQTRRHCRKRVVEEAMQESESQFFEGEKNM